MKRIFLFFALLAGIAVMTGCQKDQNVVTLKAVISQNTKAYFGGTAENIPYWDATDEVYVKGPGNFTTNIFGLTNPSTTVATITGVPECDVYSAIYPARMVISMETPHPSVTNSNNEIVTPAGTSALIYYDPHQMYKEVNGHQQVDMPMGSVTEDNTLIFKNLCSIIRLNVTNGLANSSVSDPYSVPPVQSSHVDFDVHRLTVQATGAYIAGYGNVTLSSVDDPGVNMATPNHLSTDNVLSVYDEDYSSMGTITQTGITSHKSFDIVVPPFRADNLVLEVEMYEHTTDGSKKVLGYYEYEVGHSVSVERNKIVPINLTIDRYKIFDYAYLEDGPSFNDSISKILTNQVTLIKFNYYPGGLTQQGLSPENQWTHATPTNWVELQAPNSPHKIYGYITNDGNGNPTILEINSFAKWIYCHADCSHMFEDFEYVTNIQWTWNVLFKTDDVTDMSWMFKGCTRLSNLPNINDFNTTNVTNMAHMFEGTGFYGLDLSYFNTHHLRDTGMVAMFKGCYRIQTLNLSSFTTEQITNMKDLFNGCRKLHTQDGLNISQFDMSNVTTLTRMCTDLNADGSADDKCAIICNQATKNAILGTDNGVNHPEVTGIDPTVVYFPNQGESAK